MRQRVIETNVGIQGEFVTADYDVFCRNMRDKGWLETAQVLKAGITDGEVLEIGPGPGYLGLEWLKTALHAHLTGLEISPDMIRIAQRNAREYGFVETRYQYVQGNAMEMPFKEGRFDAVFSNGSLHEWEKPECVFTEIYRVLKPGGRFVVSDLKRNVSWPVRWFMHAGTRPKSMRAGLSSSLNAAYTVEEMRKMAQGFLFGKETVTANAFGLVVSGQK